MTTPEDIFNTEELAKSLKHPLVEQVHNLGYDKGYKCGYELGSSKLSRLSFLYFWVLTVMVCIALGMVASLTLMRLMPMG